MFYIVSKLAYLVLRPSNAMILAMVFGLLLRHTRLRRFAVLAFMLGFGWMVLAAWSPLPAMLIQPLESRFGKPGRLDPPPTGIIVLGGVVDAVASAATGSIEMSDGAERVVAAALLAREYPTARVVYSGGHGGTQAVPRTESELAAPLLQAFGVAPERLVIEAQSRNTIENATVTFDLVQPRPDERWLLVTSAFHMPRAIGTFRAAGWSNLIAYPVDYRQVRTAPLVGTESASAGLFLADIAVREWLGLAAYRFYGYTDALLPGP